MRLALIDDVADAVAAAKTAFEQWSQTSLAMYNGAVRPKPFGSSLHLAGQAEGWQRRPYDATEQGR